MLLLGFHRVARNELIAACGEDNMQQYNKLQIVIHMVPSGRPRVHIYKYGSDVCIATQWLVDLPSWLRANKRGL